MSETMRNITNKVTIRLNLEHPITRSHFTPQSIIGLGLAFEQKGFAIDAHSTRKSRDYSPIGWYKDRSHIVTIQDTGVQHKFDYEFQYACLEQLGIKYDVEIKEEYQEDVDYETNRFEHLSILSISPGYIFDNCINSDWRFSYQETDDYISEFKIGKLAANYIRIKWVGDENIYDEDSMITDLEISYDVKGAQSEYFKSEQDNIRDFNQKLADDIGSIIYDRFKIKAYKLFSCNAMVDVHISASCDMYIGQPVEEEE